MGDPQLVLAQLIERLQEPAPGRIQLVVGPRQVGKTTLLLELASHFERSLYAAADAPEAAVPGYWERFWADAEEHAQHGTTIVLIDEINVVPDWAARRSPGC